MTVHADVNVDALAVRGTDRPAMVAKALVPSLTHYEGLPMILENIPKMGKKDIPRLLMTLNRGGRSHADNKLREASRKRLGELNFLNG